MRTFSVVLCFICGLLPFLTQGQNIENEWRLTSANAALLSPKDSLDNEGWRLRLSENRYFFYNQKSGDSLSGKYLYDAPSLVLMAKDNKAVQLRVNQPSEDKLEFTSGEKSLSSEG